MINSRTLQSVSSLTNKFRLIGMIEKRSNPLGAKNNDSHLKKQAIVIFYTMEYRKCGNFNSKNDTRPCNMVG